MHGGDLRVYGAREGLAARAAAGVVAGVGTDGEAFVDVAPRGDRLVVFLSHLEHEVRETPHLPARFAAGVVAGLIHGEESELHKGSPSGLCAGGRSSFW